MGQHDGALRRRAKRSGRESGCWTYISAEQMRAAGLSTEQVPFYRVWAGKRGRFIVTLYPDR